MSDPRLTSSRHDGLFLALIAVACMAVIIALFTVASGVAHAVETDDAASGQEELVVAATADDDAADESDSQGAAAEGAEESATTEKATENTAKSAAVEDEESASEPETVAPTDEPASGSSASDADASSIEKAPDSSEKALSVQAASSTSISGAKITVSNVVYTGKKLTPAVTVKKGSKTLKKGTDYTVTYKNNVKVGTAKVVVKGIGAYSGKKTVTFTIYAKPSYKRGATKMPVKSTSTWTVKNAKLRVASGKSVKVVGNVVTAVKKGTSEVEVVDLAGKVVATKTIKVYKLTGNVKLRLASSSNLFLNIEGASKDNGGNAIVSTKSSAKSQKFKLKLNSDGTYGIVSVNSGKYIQQEFGSTENKANVKQWKKSGKPSQRWGVKVDSKNRLIFVNMGSAKVMSIIKTTQADGANVLQYQENGRANQKWVVSGKRDYGAKTEANDYTIATNDGEAIAFIAAQLCYSRHTTKSDGHTGTKFYMRMCNTLGSYYTKNEKQMQCNVPVALAVKASGTDEKFPNGNKEMYYYMQKSSKWKCLGNYNNKTSMLKPGDILIRIGGVTVSRAGKTASNNHACIYIGKAIADSTYKNLLKGTDADMGAPTGVFVSAHVSNKNPAKRSAACIETASQAFADGAMIVFRYVG